MTDLDLIIQYKRKVIMNFEEYSKAALRTESKIEKVTTNKTTLLQILNAIIASGNLLDQIKKNVFYKKPIDQEKYDNNIAQLMGASWAIDVGEAPFPMVETEDIIIDPRIFHSLVGLITESAELAEALRKIVKDEIQDNTNILEEIFDLAWYQNIAIDTLGSSFEEGLTRNVAKLRARFPNKFTTENAINRDLIKEREILEGK